MTIFDVLYPRFKIDKPIRLIELFGGIGSQAKSLQNIGVEFEHWKYIDFDKYAVMSYNAIHGTDFIPSDITKIKANDLEIIDSNKYCYIMTYSFPCQDLSLAGKQKGMSKGTNTRSGLLWEVERLLKESKELPQVLLMENVPEVIGTKNVNDFNEWQLFLEQLGYKSYHSLLNAKDYGIPQNRNRCFMISILGDYSYTFPEKQELKLILKDLLEDEIDAKYYISIEQWNRLQNFNNIKHINEDICQTLTDMAGGHRQPKIICNINPSGNGMNGNVFDSEGLSPTLTTNKGEGIKNREATKKGYAEAHDGDGIYINRPHQKRGVVQKQMIQTITCNNNDLGIIDGVRIRKLTPKECWRLMGFDDEDYEKAAKVNSNTQLYKQAGNSIVVNVLMGIFKGFR